MKTDAAGALMSILPKSPASTAAIASSITPQTANVVVGVIAYCFCSSSMLLVNKMAMGYVPVASLVNTLQMGFAIAVVYFMKFTGIAKVGQFESSKVNAYALYSAGFALGIYCNMKALAVSNVETIIVFRSCCPLAVSFLEYQFLGRELPSGRSLFALLMILFGAFSYVATDKEFSMNGYSAYTWSFAYFVVICFQMTYGKYLVSEVKMEMWTRVLYNQVLGIPPTLLLGLVMNDDCKMDSVDWSTMAQVTVLLSCVMGVGISYAGFNCQSLVSGTSYALIGLMNKMITVLVNLLIWDNHASALGLASLSFCIAGGFIYKQPPLREAYRPVPAREVEMESGRLGAKS